MSGLPGSRVLAAATGHGALQDLQRLRVGRRRAGVEEGFERSVDKVAALEIQLGIEDLKQFTPRA